MNFINSYPPPKYPPILSNVKVYNEKDTMNKRRAIIQPGSFKINGFKNCLYEVEGNVNGKNKTQLIPRYKLDFI